MKRSDIVYDLIGAGYNTTRQSDPYIADRLLQHLNPQIGEVYLDIGCGTGNYTIALAGSGLNFWGIDPSEKNAPGSKSKIWQACLANGVGRENPGKQSNF